MPALKSNSCEGIKSTLAIKKTLTEFITFEEKRRRHWTRMNISSALFSEGCGFDYEVYFGIFRLLNIKISTAVVL